MQCLHYFAYHAEPCDPLLVLFCSVGYPLVAPGEQRDAVVEPVFIGRPLAFANVIPIFDDPVSSVSGVCPENEGNRQSPKRHGETKHH